MNSTMPFNDLSLHEVFSEDEEYNKGDWDVSADLY